MPRTRGTEMPQRPSLRGPPNLRTSSSDSDPMHHRIRTERSPKLADGRSPRGAQSDPLHQRKLGTRIADLESQLGQAQEELKSLKHQLASAEAAKTAAQEQLEKKAKKLQKVPSAVDIHERHSIVTESEGLNKSETPSDVQQETDVFEVPIEKVTLEPASPADQDEPEPKSISLSEPENSSSNELALKDDEINLLKTKLDERDKELKYISQENENLKCQLNEASLKVSSAESAIEELTSRLNKADQELERSRTGAAHMYEKLEATEKAKEELENEMKRLRVQTEQWRKAADAAASVLAGEVEMSGRRISERCGSMDKHYGSSFETVGGYAGYVGSPGLINDPDDAFGSGKRKGSGIRMFGDLWKKKGHK